jgi:Hg(II)-responsive transcriptional regulator
MRIGDVAKHSGVGVETIRFYEQKGLIEQPEKPNSGGFRDYPEDSVQRIQFVRSAQLLGFSLAEIMELLELETGGNSQCVDVRARAERKRREVQEKIDSLGKIKNALDHLIEACPGQGPAKRCSILAAINTGELHLGANKIGETNDR